MNRTRKRATSWLVFFATGSLMHAGLVPAPLVEFRHTYSLSPTGHVMVQNLYGNVSITAWDRDEVLVEAIKRSADPQASEDAHIVVESCSGGLSIHTQYASAETLHPASVEYRITVPRTASLDQISLVNGALSLRGLAGAVKATAVNGNISARELAGQADLSTVNGRLNVDFNRVNPANPISLRSVNGPITLSLPQDAGAVLEARNRSGGIATEFGEATRGDEGEELHARLNQGGAEIHVHNINGGISIHGAPAPMAQRTGS